MEDLQNTIHALTLAEMDIREKNNELYKINNKLLVTQEELTRLNVNLEKRVRERTNDIERLLKQKDDFIGQLGHDLKTPLTPLNILIPIAKERTQDPKLKEMLEIALNNIKYMKKLVLKTLALAQLNSDAFTFSLEDINLSEHVRTIVDMDSTLFEGNNIHVQNNISHDIIVQADPLQINEVFNNLISNAVKYSQDGGVTITLDAKKKDDVILIWIKDDGIGLDSDQLPYVFDEFYKADDSRHDLHSTGLGLTICKRIVEKHGGRIWVESLGKGKGSTFFFTLRQSNNVSI
jgi:signal transduction histidine kinase